MALPSKSEIGLQLRTARQSRGVSQSSLSRRTGVPQSAISRIENGDEVPSIQRYRRLLAGVGLTVELELRPLSQHRGDPNHAQAIEQMTPGERLERAAGWIGFASELRGAASGAERPA